MKQQNKLTEQISALSENIINQGPKIKVLDTHV